MISSCVVRFGMQGISRSLVKLFLGCTVGILILIWVGCKQEISKFSWQLFRKTP